MKKNFFLLLVVFMGFLFTTVAASADTYNFTLTNTDTNDVYAWQLPSSPTPDFFILNQFFEIETVPATFNGSQTTFCDMNFFPAANAGGLNALDSSCSSLFDLRGDQLYTGTEASPTFKTGSFELADLDSTARQRWNLTIAPAQTAPVPEPASLVLLGSGIAGVATARRRKKRA